MTIRNFLDSCLRSDHLPQKSMALCQMQQCTQSEFDCFFLELSLLWLWQQSQHKVRPPESAQLDQQMRLQFGASEDDN